MGDMMFCVPTFVSVIFINPKLRTMSFFDEKNRINFNYLEIRVFIKKEQSPHELYFFGTLLNMISIYVAYSVYILANNSNISAQDKWCLIYTNTSHHVHIDSLVNWYIFMGTIPFIIRTSGEEHAFTPAGINTYLSDFCFAGILDFPEIVKPVIVRCQGITYFDQADLTTVVN